MNSPFPLLQIENLSIQFPSEGGKQEVVRGLNLTINSGQAVGLVGESGSGKSVTALSILRLLQERTSAQVQGKMLWRGADSPVGTPSVDLLQLPTPDLRRLRGNRIAMIFQEPMTALNPLMRCGEQIAEVLRLHKGLSKKEAYTLAVEWLKRTRLADPERIAAAYPHQISGGQKQRVLIAMAMCCEPELLIADEPTTALDATVKTEMLLLMQQLSEEHGTSLLLISHDLALVGRFTTQLAVMYKGELVEKGPTASLFRHPQHPYSQALLACRPSLGQVLKRLPLLSDFLPTEDNGYRPVSLQEVLLQLRTSELEQTQRKEFLSRQPSILSVENLTLAFSAPTANFGTRILNWWRKNRETAVAENILPKTPERSPEAEQGEREAVTSVSSKPLLGIYELSFQVRLGETLGILGASGSGKTTLAKVLMRLQEPQAGSVRFLDSDWVAWRGAALRSRRRHIQMVFQDPYSSLHPQMRIGAAITEPLRVHGIGSSDQERKQRVYALLERVGLAAEHYHRYPHEFSGGQRQRICIARALALEPLLLVCDEAVSSLDVSVQAQVINLLKELQQDLNLTYIFISHDLAIVRHISDRVLVLDQGRVAEYGDTEAVFRNPQSAVTKRLLLG